MKKSILIMSTLLFFSFCFAQTDTWMVEMDVKIDGSKVEEANADLSQIELDFCDRPGEKSIEYTLSPNWKQDICINAINWSERDIEVTIEFVDGTLTNDERQNKACMNAGQNENFGQYVGWYTSSFIIPANDLVIKHAKLQLPQQSSWTINGCLVYYTKSVEASSDGSFSILMRKAKFIDINVTENVFIKNNIFSKKYLLPIIGILLIIYSIKTYRFSNKKKLPKNK